MNEKIISDNKEARWAKLMQAAQEGDSSSYEMLLREITVGLRHYVQKRIDPISSEDVVQDILLSIHKVRHSYHPSRLFGPWMYAIAYYRMMDYLRSYYRKAKREDAFNDKVEGFATSDVKAFESHDTLSKAMANFPENQRKAIELLKIKGFSIKEAAKKMDMSEGALKVTAHRAYKALRERLC